jgi:hypothetical protein
MAVGADFGSPARDHSAARRRASIGSRRCLHRARHDSPQGLRGRVSGHAVTPICTQGFLFLRPMRAASCAGHSISATSSPQCWTGASHAASDGLIWPKDGCASIAWAATAAVRLSSPGLRPFLARAKKVSPPPSSAALRPEEGCVVDRLRPADRHRGRDGRGARTAKEK